MVKSLITRICPGILLLALPLVLAAQAPAWNWAHSIDEAVEETGESQGTSITVDAITGASYSTSQFTGTIDGDPGPGVYNLSFAGETSVAIFKFDSTGNFVWARGIGGTADSWVHSYQVLHDPGGYIYLAGDFHETIDFDPGPAVYNVTAQGWQSAYLLKLDLNGNLVWVKTWGELSSYVVSRTIAINYASNHVYCAGNFAGQVDVDPGPGIFYLYPGDYSTFISKFDGNGNFITAGDLGGFGEVSCNWMDFDQEHQVLLITGHYYLWINFSPLGSYYMTSEGDYDAYVLCLGSNFEFNWVAGIGLEDAIARGHTVAYNTAGNGSWYVSGWISDTMDMDPGNDVFLLPSGNFILKLNLTGEFQWAIRYGNPLMDCGPSLAVEKNGNGGVFTIDAFSGTYDVDPGPGTTLLVSNGEADLFISKLDSNGNFLFAKQAGGEGIDLASAIALSPGNYPFITGYFESSLIDFDNITLSNTINYNTLIAKLGNASCTSIVLNTNDAGPGSLRDVIACVPGGTSIDFDLPPNSQIVLTSGEIIINKNITLVGSGMLDLTISGNNASRIFHLLPGKSLTLENMALKNASYPSNGGAIWTEGDLELKNVLFENNLESGIAKSMTLVPGVELNLLENIQLRL